MQFICSLEIVTVVVVVYHTIDRPARESPVELRVNKMLKVVGQYRFGKLS
jgi:hypothetical protein